MPGTVITALALVAFITAAAAFIWAAKKDGAENRAAEERLDIRRRRKRHWPLT